MEAHFTRNVSVFSGIYLSDLKQTTRSWNKCNHTRNCVSCYMLWLWACFYPKLISNKVKQLRLRWFVHRGELREHSFSVGYCAVILNTSFNQAVPGTAQPLCASSSFSCVFVKPSTLGVVLLQFLTVKE